MKIRYTIFTSVAYPISSILTFQDTAFITRTIYVNIK
jgi:hypothetical protein